MWSFSSVIVPTVEREVRTGLVWSMAMVDAVEELPRVGAEGLDVAPLALGVERVEDERRLPGTGDARHDDKLAGRDRQVEVF